MVIVCSVLFQRPVIQQECYHFQVGSDLFQWALGMMINAWRMTSLHGIEKFHIHFELIK